MLVKTKCFGEVEINDNKIIYFENGILGFEDYKKYTLIYDSEKNRKTIMWLQSVDESSLALPVIDPMLISEEYSPVVEDELLDVIGGITDENMFILVILTVPSDITKMTANYKAPVIINTDTLRGIQLIAENEEYMVKHPVYDILKARKGGE